MGSDVDRLAFCCEGTRRPGNNNSLLLNPQIDGKKELRKNGGRLSYGPVTAFGGMAGF